MLRLVRGLVCVWSAAKHRKQGAFCPPPAPAAFLIHTTAVGPPPLLSAVGVSWLVIAEC